MCSLTGSVTFKWFTNGSCDGAAAATSSTFTLAAGSVDGTTFTQTPGVSGSFSFQAVYEGAATYNGSTGACEPLAVGKIASSAATGIPMDLRQSGRSVSAS